MPAKKNTTTGTRGRPVDADGQQTRRRILAAARDCFSHHGYANATNRMIASEAGITASALYNYFPAKVDIYCAVLEEAEHYVAAIYENTIRDIDSPLQAICALLDLNIRMYGKYSGLTFFFGHMRSEISRNPELAAVVESRESPTEKILRRLIHAARQQGELSRAIPEKNIEMMLFACMLGLSTYGLRVDNRDQSRNMQAFRMLLDGSLTSQKP
ncbi:MAG TPA: TetR/AcrR family transcriptional regulator [Pseudomonadales bacterium]